jgi:hypothetical protein
MRIAKIQVADIPQVTPVYIMYIINHKYFTRERRKNVIVYFNKKLFKLKTFDFTLKNI